MEQQEVINDIAKLKRYWEKRNKKFRDWYEILLLVDLLATKKMESYASNEPQTFYNMAHYLLTKGELSHSISIADESAIELDRRARVNRGCEFMWKQIDKERQAGGEQTFIDDAAFFLLVLGWYSMVYAFDKETGLLKAQVWNPADTYPRFVNNRTVSCVHSYKITEEEAKIKAQDNGWSYTSPVSSPYGFVTLDDYFYQTNEALYNMILIDNQDVTGWVDRPDMKLVVGAVGGFPDKGSLTQRKRLGESWKELKGRGIFEVNANIGNHFNKWKSEMSQILRDTSQPITQEHSGSPNATPEQLRERGALFHYAPGEAGLSRLPPAAIPIELQAHLVEMRREIQKGSFNDAVYGMVEGQPGYALSLLATSSANQILYPYMDGKHLIISGGDEFWLSRLKTSKRVFNIRGKFLEKLSPVDIPENVTMEVESDVATPKDWLERGTIGGMVREDFDKATLLSEIYKVKDPQAILRRKALDRALDHPMTQNVELIASYYVHADYLEKRGDLRQAELFKKAAQALEGQLGVPPAGQGRPEESPRIEAEREAGSPKPRATSRPEIAPPETRGGFTPQQLRGMVGSGRIKR